MPTNEFWDVQLKFILVEQLPEELGSLTGDYFSIFPTFRRCRGTCPPGCHLLNARIPTRGRGVRRVLSS